MSWTADMHSEKFVVGTGVLLQWALASWAEVTPDERLRPIDIGQDAAYRFDLASLNGVLSPGATAFVAWGPQFLNFQRLELMGALKARGIKLPALICRGANVSDSAIVGENCAIWAGAVVGAHCQLGFNSVIGSGSVVGPTARLGNSVWVEAGAHIAAGGVVGSNATIGRGVCIEAAAQVGKGCIVETPGLYCEPIGIGTFHLAAFHSPVVIVNG